MNQLAYIARAVISCVWRALLSGPDLLIGMSITGNLHQLYLAITTGSEGTTHNRVTRLKYPQLFYRYGQDPPPASVRDADYCPMYQRNPSCPQSARAETSISKFTVLVRHSTDTGPFPTEPLVSAICEGGDHQQNPRFGLPCTNTGPYRCLGNAESTN